MPEYAHMIKEAEQAVAAMKDPELKQIAFGKILDSLLAGTHHERSTKIKTARAQTAPTQKKEKHKRNGPQAYIDELIGDDFFEKPKTLAEVRTELGNRGRHIPLIQLSTPIQRLCQKKKLRRQKALEGKKHVYTYSVW